MLITTPGYFTITNTAANIKLKKILEIPFLFK